MSDNTNPQENPSLGGIPQPEKANPQQGIAATIEGQMGAAATGTEELEIKDRIDDAIPKGPKKADQHSGGRVMVGERGDLNELASRRQSA